MCNRRLLHQFSLLVAFVSFFYNNAHADLNSEQVQRNSLEFYVGEPIQLNCSSSDVSWTHNDYNVGLDSSESDDNEIAAKNGNLFIRSASYRDAGIYVCLSQPDERPLGIYQILIKAAKPHEEESLERISEMKELPTDIREDEPVHHKTYINDQNLDTDQESDEKPDSSHEIGSETPLEEQFLNRLSVIESKAYLMQATVEARLERMEHQMGSLVRALNGHLVDSPAAKSTVSKIAPSAAGEAVAEQGVENGRYINEYTWIIPNAEEAIEKNSKNHSYFLQSPTFYTHRPGYRMRLLFYPNYKLQNVSGLFAGLLPGEYDSLLPWPFPHDYQLTVVSHQPNVVDDGATIRLSVTNCSPGVFERPISANPPACGFREFISHAKLNRRKRAYLIYGNLMVKIRIFVEL